jgi:DNA-binding NtrC family response regulator
MTARPVVLIDQDPDWCARLCRFMEPHGISVVVARNIEDALETIAQVGKPGAFVMDTAARHANGRAVLAIRTEAAFRDVPVAYVKKSAALDALLLMLASSTAVATHQAA